MILAMIKKEFLLVLRDKHSLLALFLMPAVFILIMSVALRNQFAIEQIEMSIFVIDQDQTEQAQQFIDTLNEDSALVLMDSPESADFIVTIPMEVKKRGSKLTIEVASGVKQERIELIKARLLKKVVDIQLDVIVEKLKELSEGASSAVDRVSLSYEDVFNITYTDNRGIPNSTQQSVPSWIVFGMFFVVIPMSTIYINERNQHTLLRLASMNISLFTLTVTKTVPYLIINQIQVWIMLMVGMFLVPLLDTPALEINGSIVALMLLSVSLSFSAIGLATLIAVSSTTSEQATTVGGILNILLGALGGVMIPKFLMPESLQSIAEFSPMSWGLDGFLNIFLAGFGVSGVADESLKLLLFGLVSIGISIVVLRQKIYKRV